MVSELLMIDVVNRDSVPVLVAVMEIVSEFAFICVLVVVLVPPVFVPVAMVEAL